MNWAKKNILYLYSILNTATEQKLEPIGINAIRICMKHLRRIKADNALEDCVYSVRDGLDNVVYKVIDKILNPTRWIEEADKNERNRAG